MATVRQFTLRLEEAEDKQLTKLKELSGENTDTGIIKYCIRNYADLNNRLVAEIEKRGKAERLFFELKSKTSFILSTLAEITKLVGK